MPPDEHDQSNRIPQAVYAWYNAHYNNQTYQAFRAGLTDSAWHGNLSDTQTNDEVIHTMMNDLIDACFNRIKADLYPGAEARLMAVLDREPFDSRIATLARLHLANFDGFNERDQAAIDQPLSPAAEPRFKVGQRVAYTIWGRFGQYNGTQYGTIVKLTDKRNTIELDGTHTRRSVSPDNLEDLNTHLATRNRLIQSSQFKPAERPTPALTYVSPLDLRKGDLIVTQQMGLVLEVGQVDSTTYYPGSNTVQVGFLNGTFRHFNVLHAVLIRSRDQDTPDPDRSANPPEER